MKRLLLLLLGRLMIGLMFCAQTFTASTVHAQKNLITCENILTCIPDAEPVIVTGGGDVVVTGNGSPTNPYVVSFTETVTSISYDPVSRVVSYIDESGTQQTFNLSGLVTNVQSADSSVDVTGSDGAASAWDLSVTHTINGDGSITLNDGTVVPAPDGSETIVTASGDITVSGTGTTGDPYVVAFSESLTAISYNPVTHEITYTDENGDPNVLDLSGLSTTSSLSGPAGGVLTHTQDDGTTTNHNLISTDAGNTVVAGADGALYVPLDTGGFGIFDDNGGSQTVEHGDNILFVSEDPDLMTIQVSPTDRVSFDLDLLSTVAGNDITLGTDGGLYFDHVPSLLAGPVAGTLTHDHGDGSAPTTHNLISSDAGNDIAPGSDGGLLLDVNGDGVFTFESQVAPGVTEIQLDPEDCLIPTRSLAGVEGWHPLKEIFYSQDPSHNRDMLFVDDNEKLSETIMHYHKNLDNGDGENEPGFFGIGARKDVVPERFVVDEYSLLSHGSLRGIPGELTKEGISTVHLNSVFNQQFVTIETTIPVPATPNPAFTAYTIEVFGDIRSDETPAGMPAHQQGTLDISIRLGIRPDGVFLASQTNMAYGAHSGPVLASVEVANVGGLVQIRLESSAAFPTAGNTFRGSVRAWKAANPDHNGPSLDMKNWTARPGDFSAIPTSQLTLTRRNTVSDLAAYGDVDVAGNFTVNGTKSRAWEDEFLSAEERSAGSRFTRQNYTVEADQQYFIAPLQLDHPGGSLVVNVDSLLGYKPGRIAHELDELSTSAIWIPRSGSVCQRLDFATRADGATMLLIRCLENGPLEFQLFARMNDPAIRRKAEYDTQGRMRWRKPVGTSSTVK